MTTFRHTGIGTKLTVKHYTKYCHSLAINRNMNLQSSNILKILSSVTIISTKCV